MVFGFSKEERDERHRERAADSAAKKLAQQKRRAGRRRGMVEKAEKEGYEEGKHGKQGGILGALQGAIKTASKHVEIGPRKGQDDFSLFGMGDRNGPSHIGLNADDLGLGLSSQRTAKGKKKRDPYAELGL